jgi:alpha-N-acetylglucosaminidase
MAWTCTWLAGSLVSPTFATAAAGDPARAARGVLERTIGPRAADFELRVLPAGEELDYAIVSASDGKVRVAGTSGVAICRGAYEYLREKCHALVTWEGSHLPLPEKFPDMPARRIESPYKFRHYFNVCTFGYTMTWWDWSRWEREIDWMALHGINMPLAMTGTETVWQEVWREMGLGQGEIDRYFTGPAFLPWHRMGNINTHLGPLPQEWHQKQAKLQKRILTRQRELGMKPVVPGFSGFVPPGFEKAHPQAMLRRSTAWAGFESTMLLDARDPLFVEIGRRYIEKYKQLYGTDHLYLADTFNEMPPPFEEATKLADLKASGEGVYRAITAGDPEGIWVMQGWLFFNERNYWGPKEVEALLSGVPNDRMILLDLATDLMQIWKLHEPFRQKQWIACTLHNFGQATALFGDLQDFAVRPATILGDPARGNLVGAGLTMEGIEQNAIVYELVADTMWRREPIELEPWIAEYIRNRYGDYPQELQEAWALIRRCVYLPGGLPQFGAMWSSNYIRRPRLDVGADPGEAPKQLAPILELYLKVADRFGDNALFRRDLVDLAKRYVQECAAVLLYDAMSAYDAGDAEALGSAAQRYLALLADADRLLDTQPAHRLSAWIAAARSWSNDPKIQDLFEQNARTQVTIWGGPILYDYAAKEWSGLVSSFYRERWRRFFDELQRTIERQDFDTEAWDRAIARWEEEWTKRTDLPTSPAPGEAIQLVRDLLRDYGDVADTTGVSGGIAVGKPVRVSGGTEGAQAPELAVDGEAGNRDRGWYASPAPQWIMVDLESPTAIGAVTVFTYWDGKRYYRYNVEVSPDGETWQQVVDMSANTRPARPRGHTHRFPATTARYVRLNMLENSANVGVHVIELRVHAPQS